MKNSFETEQWTAGLWSLLLYQYNLASVEPHYKDAITPVQRVVSDQSAAEHCNLVYIFHIVVKSI